MDKKLLEIRERVKRKKPKFGRKDSNKKKRIESDVWRKARGCDNKQRLKRKGHKKTPRQGFRSPIQVRGLDASGLMPFLVTNPKQVMALTNEQGIIISSSMGDRKRKIVIDEAAKKGLTILNLDAAKRSEQISAKLLERKQEKKTLEEQKKKQEKQEKKDIKKEEPKQDEPADLSEEDKKKQEKEEKDRLLTMK
jgi:large subunit ribosomal protein L32e